MRKAVRIVRRRADDLVEEQRGVLDRLGERPVDRRVTVTPVLRRAEGDAAEGGLEAERPREARGNADRAACAALRDERRHGAAERCGAAAARAAGGSREIPGRAGGAVNQVLGDRREAE